MNTTGHDHGSSGIDRMEILSLLRIDLLWVFRRGRVYPAREVFQLVRDQWGIVHERRLWRCLLHVCRAGWVEYVPDGAAVPRHVDAVYRVTPAGRLARERLSSIGDAARSGITRLRGFSRSRHPGRLRQSPRRWTYLRNPSTAVAGTPIRAGVG